MFLMDSQKKSKKKIEFSEFDKKKLKLVKVNYLIEFWKNELHYKTSKNSQTAYKNFFFISYKKHINRLLTYK
jgi:hypothetical protein